MARYQPPLHHALVVSYEFDPVVVCHAYTAWVLWPSGYLDQALQRSREALTLAWEGTHPYTLALALNWAATLHMLLRKG